MKTTRKTFWKLLGAMWPAAGGLAGMAAPGPSEILPGPSPAFPDPELFEWLKQPRIPIWVATDYPTQTVIRRVLSQTTVEFSYYGGSTPGATRRISPSLVFTVPDYGGVYVSGYCHTRQAERTFRVDRMRIIDERIY